MTSSRGVSVTVLGLVGGFLGGRRQQPRVDGVNTTARRRRLVSYRPLAGFSLILQNWRCGPRRGIWQREYCTW
jgi:hypothetical protein